MKTVNFKGKSCIVKKSNYRNNDNLALILIDSDDCYSPTPVAYITVNTDDVLDQDCAYIKDYSENSGMFDACQEAGLIKEILGVKQLGFVTAPLVMFNLEDVDKI